MLPRDVLSCESKAWLMLPGEQIPGGGAVQKWSLMLALCCLQGLHPALPKQRWSSPFLLSDPATPPPSVPAPRGAGHGSQPASPPMLCRARAAHPLHGSVLHTPTSVRLYPEEGGRGAKPPTAQLWVPEIDPQRSKSSLKPLCLASMFAASTRSYRP